MAGCHPPPSLKVLLKVMLGKTSTVTLKIMYMLQLLLKTCRWHGFQKGCDYICVGSSDVMTGCRSLCSHVPTGEYWSFIVLACKV